MDILTPREYSEGTPGSPPACLSARSPQMNKICCLRLVAILWIPFVAGCLSWSHGVRLRDVPALAEFRLEPTSSQDWQMHGNWVADQGGARPEGRGTATRLRALPSDCIVELTATLPSQDNLKQPATLALTVKAAEHDDQRIEVQARFQKHQCRVQIKTPGPAGRPRTKVIVVDGRPAIERAWGEMKDHPGWAGQTVSLALALTGDTCGVLFNGGELLSIRNASTPGRQLEVGAQRLTLRTCRVLPGVSPRYSLLSGDAVARLNLGPQPQGAAHGPSTGPALALVSIGDVPMLVTRGADGEPVTLAVSAERRKAGTWSEGKGMPTHPVPDGPYSAAYLLLRCPPTAEGQVRAMGFGLRVPEMAAADLHNVYLGDAAVRSSDEGVTVRPVPALGEGWHFVRVPLNPAAQDMSGFHACFVRPWIGAGGTPQPAGPPSAVHVAALTLERPGIELRVQGNGLGNVTCEPDTPELRATLRNLTPEPISVELTRELVAFGRDPVRRPSHLVLQPHEKRTVDALPVAIDERGHYRVRVVADAGEAGRIDFRSNVALLAPDTRQKINSPFGCWLRLWTDISTPEQLAYLKEKAGVGFDPGKNWFYRLGKTRADEKKAAEIAAKIGPKAKIFMLGWEHMWSLEHTFHFPRIIAEGKPEQLPEALSRKADDTAAEFRRIAAAVRKHRPDVKISLGNGAVNYSVPLLERGFALGREFDYFGTEEGIFWAAPEQQPNDAVGNVNWWARTVCEHYGFRNVPVFHSEAIYFSTGPGFSRLAELTQAAYYVRTYLLGFPYDSVFGICGAMVDSSNHYIYSLWGASGYCNRAPDCSPKLSYAAYATLTQLLDGATYSGKLDPGTTSVYALRFKRTRGGPVCAMWNLHGSRRVTVRFTHGDTPRVVDGLNREVPVTPAGDAFDLTLSELPLYVSGVEIEAVQPRENYPAPTPKHRPLNSLACLVDWAPDTAPDTGFEKPLDWKGIPKVMGEFSVSRVSIAPPEAGYAEPEGSAFRLAPKPGTHGLIPRYVSLRAAKGSEIAIPRGTAELGVWIRGRSTWGRVKIGLRDDKGRSWLVLSDDSFGRMVDDFDGWRFVTTGPLGRSVQEGQCRMERIVVTMPEQQVYVDDLCATPEPEIVLFGLSAVTEKPKPITYQPW